MTPLAPFHLQEVGVELVTGYNVACPSIMGFCSFPFRVWSIHVIEDKAKQALAKMVLETEWEACFPHYIVYGF